MIADALKCSAQMGSQQTWGLQQDQGYARTAQEALPALHLCYYKRYNVYCVLGFLQAVIGVRCCWWERTC